MPDISSFVTGNSLAALDESGRFVFSDSVDTGHHERIDFEKATALSCVRTFWRLRLPEQTNEGLK
ncbi:MAG: hypothetical protein L0271_00345 [Gemmatimonadetes bacterium]|nr:hypothetical protein [Gemmatimonadota bacterium]